jgi:hypothetical protein
LPGKLLQNITGSLLIGFKIGVQVIWKKKELKHSEHYQQLDKNNLPQRFAERHPPEPVTIKTKNPTDYLKHFLPPSFCRPYSNVTKN